MSTVSWMSVCWRLRADVQNCTVGSSLVIWRIEHGWVTPTDDASFHGQSQLRPVPLKICLYVLSGFLPATNSTTRPPMRNAMSVVRSGVMTPPARW